MTGNSIRGGSGSGVVVTSGGPRIAQNAITGNGGHGVTSGGSGAALSDNAITDNGGHGVFFSGGTGTTLSMNTVTDNGGHGVFFSGGTGITVSQNTIAGSGGDGVSVSGGATGITVSRNAIADNGGLGIDLVGGDEDEFGVTSNDGNDRDDGPNELMNFPERLMATDRSATTVTGRISFPTRNRSPSSSSSTTPRTPRVLARERRSSPRRRPSVAASPRRSRPGWPGGGSPPPRPTRQATPRSSPRPFWSRFPDSRSAPKRRPGLLGRAAAHSITCRGRAEAWKRNYRVDESADQTCGPLRPWPQRSSQVAILGVVPAANRSDASSSTKRGGLAPYYYPTHRRAIRSSSYAGGAASVDRSLMHQLVSQLMDRATRALPNGGLLPEEVWHRRHGGIVVLLWMHAVGIGVFGLATGNSLGHSLLEAALVAVIAAVAGCGLPRPVQSSCATFGLVASSAILVHQSGGVIEMHFHFFVVVGLITLYQDWLPFLLAIGFVVLHHGVLGGLDPATVYNHQAAIAHPWRWALIHGLFVVGASVASLTAWKLNEQGFRDTLTGLANRSLFYDRVNHALERARRSGSVVGTLFLDLDEFKTINDSLGHSAGDRLLVEVANRLKRCLREADTAARLGGDEFGILLEGADETGATLVAERILNKLQEPFVLQGKEVFVNASIGIADTSLVSVETTELLRNADVAMYVAKSAGKGRFELFNPSMHRDVAERLDLQSDLQRAIDRGEFVLNYQPIVGCDDSKIRGVEALIRWEHPTKGLVSPACFIPIAEETGLIMPIGRWVLEQACLQASQWQLEHPKSPPLTMSVNVSGRQFQEQAVFDDVRQALEISGLEPSRLTLELTEGVLMQNPDSVIDKLLKLKKLGVKLAVDDFGTGYSSLSHLQQFPIDSIKIDRSFIEAIADGAEDSAVARAVIKLGHTWDLQVVAEGIETPEQLVALRGMACDLGQGYYFARPLDRDAMNQLLRRSAADSQATTAAGLSTG